MKVVAVTYVRKVCVFVADKNIFLDQSCLKCNLRLQAFLLYRGLRNYIVRSIIARNSFTEADCRMSLRCRLAIFNLVTKEWQSRELIQLLFHTKPASCKTLFCCGPVDAFCC